MPIHRESKPSAPPNIQDVFLNSARRERLVVQILGEQVRVPKDAVE